MPVATVVIMADELMIGGEMIWLSLWDVPVRWALLCPVSELAGMPHHPVTRVVCTSVAMGLTRATAYALARAATMSEDVSAVAALARIMSLALS